MKRIEVALCLKTQTWGKTNFTLSNKSKLGACLHTCPELYLGFIETVKNCILEKSYFNMIFKNEFVILQK